MKRTNLLPLFLVISLYVIGFVLYVQPVHGFTPTYCAASGSAGAQVATIPFLAATTTASTGAVSLGNCGINGNAVYVTAYLPANNLTTLQIISNFHLSDNLSSAYSLLEGGTYITCSNSASGGQCPKNHPGNTGTVAQGAFLQLWGMLLPKNSGHIDFTATFNAPGYSGTIVLNFMIFQGGSLNVFNGCAANFGTAADSTLIYGTGYNDYCNTLVPAAGIAIQFGMYNVNAGNTFAFSPGSAQFPNAASSGQLIGSQYCPNAANVCEFYGAYDINTATTSTNFQYGWATTTTGGGFGNWMAEMTIVIASISQSTVVTTTNQDCVGSCTSTHSGSSSYLSTNYLYLYYGQAVVSSGLGETLYNETSFVSAIHVTTASATIYLAFYTGTTSPPSIGNPLSLAWSATYNPNNNTANRWLHSTPNVNVCSGCWYAVAIMATSTASRGSGASGSGVAIAEDTINGVTLYNYNVGSPTLPVSVYTASITTPNIWLVGYLKFAVVILTDTATLTGVTTLPNGTVVSTTTVIKPAITVTSTSTVSGVITSTVFSTSVISTLANANDIISLLPNLPELLLFLITPIAVFAGLGALTKSGTGMIIMLMVGVGVDIGMCTLLGLLPFYFIIVLVLMLVLALVLALRSGGGGGGG